VIGKYGPVIKCTKDKTVTFLSVKSTIDLTKLERGEYVVEELIEQPATSLGQYEGTDLCLKRGKFGLYASWGNGSHTKSLPSLGNRPIENISREEVLLLLEAECERKDPLIPTIKRKVTNDLHIRSGKFGDYLFYKTAKMKKPQFLKLNGFTEDHITCDLTVLKTWITTTYKIVI
jgi:DNA topoisomerase-1